MAQPTDIAGLYGWYRASSFALNDGDTCGNWTDASGNGRTLTVTVTGGFPKFRTNQVAGYPAIQMTSGVFQHATFGWRANLANHTIFLVFLTSNLVAQNPVVTSEGGVAAEGPRAGSYGAGVGKFGGLWQSTVGGFSVGQPVTADAWHYGYTCLTNGVSLGCSLDGATESTTALSGTRHATYPTTVMSFNLDGGTFWNAGYIAEVFFFNSNLSSSDKAAMFDYLRSKYFDAVPSQNERVRDVLSRRLWLLRRPQGILEITVPLRMLDADILDRVAIEHQLGPDPSGAGWRGKKWQRQAFSIQRMDVNPGAGTVRLQLLDRRPLDVLLWDTARTDIPALGIDTTRRSGVAQIMKGNAIVFVRAQRAWVTNPSDASSVIEIASNEHAYSSAGEHLEEQRTNEISRSSFVDGTTGLTLTGTGTGGSAIATDPDERLFNPEVLAPSLKFTAGSPHSVDLKAAFPATASIPGGTNVRLTIDHKTDSGEPLHYQLTRSADGWFWNDATPAFQAGAVNNSLGTQSTRYAGARYHSKKIPVGAGASTLTVAVLLPSGGTASRISHLYHGQIEKGSFATSRIVSQLGVAQTRNKTEHTIEVTTAAKVYDPALGAWFCEFVPGWSSADLGSSEDRYIFWQETNGGADHDTLFYDASAGAFVFERKVGASTYTATKTASVTRGTAVKLAARWTGAEGELDLTAYTVSVFVDGVKGNDATSAAPTFTSPETLHRGHDGSKANHANGAIREVRVFPYALADEEIAALP